MNRAWLLTAGLVAGVVLASTGCHNTDKTKVQGRSQVGEDSSTEFDASTTIGQKTSVGNTEPIAVSGVGLVYGLPGTGSSATPGGWRMMLEHQLKKKGYSIKELLDNPNKTTSLVLVSALIPPGARKGDPIDVQITLPDESKTTSLKGGELLECNLYNTDTTGNIKSVVHDGRPTGPSGDLKLGDIWATASGPLVAGMFVPTSGKQVQVETDADGQPVFKVGRIWGGGKVTRNRPYFILMNPGDQNARMAAVVAERLNSTFHATSEPNLKVADAKSRELILVNVPAAYRNNHYRFLLVARQVPILTPRAGSASSRKLEEELLDPATALVAAIKLEGLGTASMQTLRVGLESPSPWVRFAAAEALTYLGQTDGAAELARLSEDHPALRAPCLKALATMDDAASTDRLADLMANPDPVLRYGGFLALRLADENAVPVRGQLVNHSFWLHSVATGSTGMVHLTTDRRCEVVLFGDNIKLRGPFILPIGGEFTISLPADGEEVAITRIVKAKGDLVEKKLTSPSDLQSVLLTVGRLGGGYNEAVELIRRADRARVLTASVVIDAIPPELNIRQLALFARQDPALVKANSEVVRAGVVRPGVDADGFDLPPQETDTAAQAPPPPPRPPLNREPGRIFGPKRHDAPVDPGLAPAGQ
jgi:flagellar basal body P-ring protein FlgI